MKALAKEMPVVAAPLLSADDRERFWSRVDVRGSDECWDWTGSVNSSGYGYITIDGRPVGAHCVALMSTGVAVGSGVHTLHSCDRPRCCNPAHLRAGSAEENMADRAARNRVPRGERQWRARLTESLVRDMRARYATGETSASIAARLGINKNTAYFAISGRSWGHVK